MYKKISISILLIFFFILVLLITDFRVLVKESKIQNAKGNDYFICKYFTGRSFVDQEMWYSPNNILGVDSCPFIRKR